MENSTLREGLNATKLRNPLGKGYLCERERMIQGVRYSRRVGSVALASPHVRELWIFNPCDWDVIEILKDRRFALFFCVSPR